MLKLDETYLNQVEEYNLKLARDHKEQGTKVVGVYCAFTPKELILAAGGIPVSLCGASNDPIPAAEKHLPRNLCPLIKSSYGFALTNTCPYFDLADILIADSTCDGKKKMYELLGKIKPVHLMHLPQNANGENALANWLSELYRIKQLLETRLETEITEEKLTSAICLYNRYRAAKSSLFEMNRGETPLLTGHEINIALDSGGLEIDIPGHINRISKVIKFARERGGIKPGPRILLTGCPTTSKKLLNIIEESANVVVMENCGGLKSLVEPVTENEEPMAALARKYLNIACPCMTPNTGRFQLIEMLVREYRVAGVIDLTWQACHTYNVESKPLGDFIKNQLDIPYLQIETDYSPSDINWIQVRVESFLEML